jgi:ABC-type lipoprotein export system ATPase subunit
MSLIEMTDVRRVYRMGAIEVPALDGVSLSIERGEMVALVGASGSGKTTLMNILGCLDRPTSGSYLLDGRDVGHMSADERAAVRNRLIGFVFQSFQLLPRTSALEQVLLPLEYRRGAEERDGRARARQLLERFGLGERLDHHPTQLSGGQQQRVAIARALVNHPPLLLADEPTGNLDSRTSLEVLEVFRRLNREEGITVVLVTHDPGVAAHAERTIHVHDGHVPEAAAAVMEESLP